MARPERVRLGDLLVQESLITPEQLQDALVAQKTLGRKLGRVFIDNGWVDEIRSQRRWRASCARRTST